MRPKWICRVYAKVKSIDTDRQKAASPGRYFFSLNFLSACPLPTCLATPNPKGLDVELYSALSAPGLCWFQSEKKNKEAPGEGGMEGLRILSTSRANILTKDGY